MGKALVNMRDARIRDHWRRALSRLYPTNLGNLQFDSLQSFRDATITFAPGITAIVGGNGVGKSTLIAAIVEILKNGDQALAIDRFDRLSGSTTRATANVSRRECTLSIETNGLGERVPTGDIFDGEIRWLDPSGFSQSCVRQIRNDSNFPDLLEPVSPAVLSPAELETVSYLIGKSYNECVIYEISDYGGLERFPYFQVVVSGEAYGSESMGRGELSLLLSYWILRDIPKCSILILEEPETHVSPRSQDHLMNIIAKFCDERAICVIAATHSPSIIRKIPPTHIRLITREAGIASVIDPPSLVQIARVLSGGVAYKGIFLVEDIGANFFLRGLLEELAGDLLPQFEVVIAGDAASIAQSITSLPRTKAWLTVVGVFDGGMQSTTNVQGSNWPHVYLPGNEAPEAALRTLVNAGASFIAEIATSLQKSEEDVRASLEFVVGLDHHEWIAEFSKMLGREVTVVRHVLVRMWIAHNEALAKAFIAEVRTRLEEHAAIVT